jgi:hypothetical protein
VTPTPAGLASLLAPARAGGAPGAARAPAHDAGALDFARLLQQAQGAELDSGRAVTLADGVEMTLSEAQLSRLAAAADRAEAAGAITAAVLIDGEALVMDVARRTITGRIDLAGGEPFYGVDTVVSAPEASGAPLAAPRPALHNNPSLLDVLSRRSA